MFLNMTMQDWFSWVGLIGTFISLVGIWLTFGQVRREIKQVKLVRRQQLADQVLAALDTVCTTPAPYISAYEDIYNDLFNHYSIQPDATHNVTSREACKDWVITNEDYILGCISKHTTRTIVFDKPCVKYAFPVITKRNFLLSKNPSLKIEFGVPRFIDDTQQITIRKEAKEFLAYFDIKDFASFLLSRGRKLWNASTFELDGLEEENEGIKLNFRLGSYNNYVNNNEIRLKELYFYRYISNRMDFKGEEIEQLLPPKYLVRNAIQLDSLFHFYKRPTSIGISAFVIMNKGGGRYCTFIQKRDNNQVEYPGFFHVAPAGTFQPLSDFDAETIVKQCHLPFTILRELLEEVFGLEEADKNKGVDPFEIFRLEIFDNQGTRFCPGRLLGINESIPMNNTKYMIVPTSFAIDLMTLKPHVSAVLIIKTPDLYLQAKSAFRGNWEGNVKEFDIDTEEFLRFITHHLDVNGFPPVGAITLAEGIDYYFTHANEFESY